MFHGADPTGAQALAQRLVRISAEMNRLVGRVLTAESLAEYSTGSVGIIDDASLVLRSTAGAVESAAHQLGTFRLPLALQWHPLARLADRVSPSEFHEVEADLFAQLMRAIGARETPTAAGLPEGYFPPGYLEWLAADDAVVEAQERLTEYRRVTEGQQTFDATVEYALAQALHERIAERSTLLFHEAITDELGETATTRSDVPGFAIAAAVARSFQSGSQLLGSHLADEASAIDDLEFVALLAAEPDVASAFFNRLGPGGTVMLAHQWADADPDGFEEVLNDLSTALGQLTVDGRLGFTGDDLVRSDRNVESVARVGDDRGFHIEQVLVHGEFDAGFVVDAAAASFDRYLTDTGSPQNLAPWYDRRLTSMAVLLRHDTVDEFLAGLSQAEMRSILGSQRFEHPAAVGKWVFAPYGQAHPSLADEDVIPTLFTAAGTVRRATADRLIDAVAEMDVRIEDQRVADGLSLLLADRTLDYFATDREPVFFDAYDTVVRSGSGLSVLLAAMGPATEQFVRRELAEGDLDHDGPKAINFGSFTARLREHYFQGRLDHADHILDDWAESDRLVLIANAAATGLGAVGAVGGLATLGGPVLIGSLMLGPLAFAAIGAISLAVGAMLLGLTVAKDDRRDPTVPVLGDLTGHMSRFGPVVEASAHRGAVPDLVQVIPVVPQIEGQDIDDWARMFSVTVDREFGSAAAEIEAEHGSRSGG